MKEKIKKIWGGVNIALIVVVAVLAIALAGVKLVGLDVYVILSGSMEPKYQTGGVIYIKDVDPQTLETGDVITYNISNGATVTHRIVDIVEENGQTMFQTKGDANENVDASLVPASQVIGHPVFTIPYLGRLVSLIQSPSGKFALMAVAAILLLMQFLPDLIFGEDDEEDDEEEVVKEKKCKRRNKKESSTQPESVTTLEPAPEYEPEPVATSIEPAPEPEPEPAPQIADNLRSFLDMDPDEFFNSLINNSKEEGK